MTDNEILERKEIREYAESLFNMFLEEANQNKNDSLKQLFFEHIVKLSQKQLPQQEYKPQPIIPMTNKECIEFRSTYIPFGKYEDKQIHDVFSTDLQYLNWLAYGTNQKFIKLLQRFLANENVQKILKEEQIVNLEEDYE